MKSRWGVVVAVGCAVAALMLVGRAWRPDAARDEVPGTAGSRQTGGDWATDGSADATARGGAASGPARLSGIPPADRGAPQRRRVPPADESRDQPGEHRVVPNAADHAPGVTHRELPRAAGQGAPAVTGGGDDGGAEPPSDVVYDGGAEHVFNTGSRVEVADAAFNRTAGTVAFWINPQWPTASQDGASFIELGDGGLRIIKDANALRFEYADGTGNENGGNVNVDQWESGEPHYVTATWNGNTLALYVDGSQIFLNTGRVPPDFQNLKVYVGSASPNGAPVALSELSHLTLLNRDASGDEVRQMFESGGAGQ